jgi:pimeloyl-ACP methyl ester carboxylesterase
MISLIRLGTVATLVLSAALAVEARQDKTDHVAGTVKANGITIAYQMDGPRTGEPLVFIHGLGGEMEEGPDAMTKALGAWGFRVIRFDSRDTGGSTPHDGRWGARHGRSRCRDRGRSASTCGLHVAGSRC